MREVVDAWNTRNWHIGAVDGVLLIERVDDFVCRGKHGAVRE